MFGSNRLIDKPFYAVETFDTKYEGELVQFLNNQGLQIQQQSSAMIVWTGSAKDYNNCEGNPIIYCPNLHKRAKDKYDISFQFSSAGIINNPNLEKFLVDLAIKCNIDEFYNQDIRKTGEALYFIVDKNKRKLIPQKKPRRLSRIEIANIKSHDPMMDKRTKENLEMMQRLGISPEQMRADIESEKQKQREQRNAYITNR